MGAEIMKNYLCAVVIVDGKTFVKLAEPMPDMPEWRQFVEYCQDQPAIQDLLEEFQMTADEFVNCRKGERQMIEHGRVLLGFLPLCGTTGEIDPFWDTLIQLHNESVEGTALGEVLGIRSLEVTCTLPPRLIGRFAVNYADADVRQDWNKSEAKEQS